MQKDLSNHSINQRPDFAQAKRECKRLHDEHLARTHPETVSTKGRGETCRHLRQDRGPTCKQLRHRRQRGTKPIGRRTMGILSILQALTIGDFLRVRTSFGCLEKYLQPTDGCVTSAPTNTARTELHSMITFHHVNTRGSRAAKLRIAHLGVPKTSVIHVPCLIPCHT